MIAFRGGRKTKNGAHRTGLGPSFSGLVSYLEHGTEDKPRAGVEAWGTRLLFARTPTAAAREMQLKAQQNPRVELPVYHFGIALEPGESLSHEQWDYTVDRFLAALGVADQHEALWVLHDDKDHQHVHVAVNRVSLTEQGKAWQPRFDRERSFRLCRELEVEMGLKLTAARSADSADYQPNGEGAAHRDRQSIVDGVRRHLSELSAASNWPEFIEILARHGYTLELAKRGDGLVIRRGKRRVSASKVHRSLSAGRLAKRFGMSYRDFQAETPHAEVDGGSAPTFPSLLPSHPVGKATFTSKDLKRWSEAQREALAPHLVEIAPERYTTFGYEEAEDAMRTHAQHLAALSSYQLGDDIVRKALSQHPYLSQEQRAAVAHATRGQDLAVILGRAGAGKTTTAKAIADAYKDAGYTVRGLAISGQAARVLEQETGIEASTFTSARYSWDKDRKMDSQTVVLLDEAGIVDVPQMRVTLHHAERLGAKIILIGDTDQLEPIGPGAALRALSERHGAADISFIRRQRVAWQREASQHLVSGRLGAAIDLYDAHEAIHFHKTKGMAATDLISRYLEEADPERSLILVSTRREMHRLNATIRDQLIEKGRLIGDPDARFIVGERLQFRRNDFQLGTRNGSLGTVQAVSEDGRARVRLDGGHEVDIDPSYRAIRGGYAVTVHSAQGSTVDRAYALIGRTDRHLAMVALTRHRDALHLYVDRETAPNVGKLKQKLSAAGHNDLITDWQSDGQPARRGVNTKMAALAAPRITRRGLEPEGQIPAPPAREALLTTGDRLALGRGLEPEPAQPLDAVAVRELGIELAQLRRDLDHLPREHADPASRYERYRLEQRVHEAASDYTYAAGVEHLPGALDTPSKVARYAELHREGHDAPTMEARLDIGRQVDQLLHRKPSSGIRPNAPAAAAARQRMVDLAESPLALETPAFRDAAQRYYQAAVGGDEVMLQAVADWRSLDSDEGAKLLYAQLEPLRDEPPRPLEARLAHLKAEPHGAAIHRLVYEVHLELRAATRREREIETSLHEALQLHRERPTPMTASHLNSLAAERRQHQEAVERLQGLYVKSLAVEAESERALLLAAQIESPKVRYQQRLEILTRRIAEADTLGDEERFDPEKRWAATLRYRALRDHLAQSVPTYVPNEPQSLEPYLAHRQREAEVDRTLNVLEAHAMARLPAFSEDTDPKTWAEEAAGILARNALRSEQLDYDGLRRAMHVTESDRLVRVVSGDRSEDILEKLELDMTQPAFFPTPSAPGSHEEWRQAPMVAQGAEAAGGAGQGRGAGDVGTSRPAAGPSPKVMHAAQEAAGAVEEVNAERCGAMPYEATWTPPLAQRAQALSQADRRLRLAGQAVTKAPDSSLARLELTQAIAAYRSAARMFEPAQELPQSERARDLAAQAAALARAAAKRGHSAEEILRKVTRALAVRGISRAKTLGVRALYSAVRTTVDRPLGLPVTRVLGAAHTAGKITSTVSQAMASTSPAPVVGAAVMTTTIGARLAVRGARHVLELDDGPSETEAALNSAKKAFAIAAKPLPSLQSLVR